MRLFRWLSDRELASAFDLRRRGWKLADDNTPIDEIGQCPALARLVDLDAAGWPAFTILRGRPRLGLVLLLNVDSGDARARFLRQGYGDAVATATGLAEIEARAIRLSEAAGSLARSRDLGRLRLDLFARDGFVGRQPLGLHPREFALIWRLAETPGVPVGKSQLLSDVWRMTFVPDTNSVAVHVFRLRAKLALAGLQDVVQTAPSGGYLVGPASSLAPTGPMMLTDSHGHAGTDMHLVVPRTAAEEAQP